ncbi:uncharacterized protein [Henckelia pumila]|uniref:uncharacterized protein isoform X3 n=1 Tax=Henckelia pumila TaxID=405737 RepID=UPI003C6E61A8
MKLKGSNEGIGSLIKDLEEPLESVELRINIVTEPRYAKAKSSKVIEAFRNYIEGASRNPTTLRFLSMPICTGQSFGFRRRRMAGYTIDKAFKTRI